MLILRMMSVDPNQSSSLKCLNCNSPITSEQKFCSSCGQKNISSRLSIWYIISDFFNNVFNIDSRLFRSVGKLFIPAKLPQEYLAGRRKSHINPARFFFLALIFHFGLLTYSVNQSGVIDSVEELETSFAEIKAEQDLLTKYNEVMSTFPDSVYVDSLRTAIFDTIIGQNLNLDTIKIQLSGFKIEYEDFMTLEREELFEKYEVISNWDKILVGQQQKIRKFPAATIRFLIGNLLWVVVLLMIFASLFLKVLYIRRNYYLIEHLTVSLYYHGVILVVLAVFYLMSFGDFIEGMESGINGSSENEEFGIQKSDSTSIRDIISYLIFLLPPLYLFFSLKRYYKQGYIMTFIKFLLLNFYEFILLIIFAVIIALVSLLIF